MIRGTESTDRILDRPRGLRRLARRKVLLAMTALGVVTALAAYPAVERWASSERSVSRARIRTATARRGDLVREVAVDGRIVAAAHPTLHSPADGIVHRQAQAGEAVVRGDLLATIESPDLESRLEQERSVAESMSSELGRQRLVGEQQALAKAQQIDLLEVRLEAALREMERMERTFAAGIVNEIEHARAADQLAMARLEVTHARRDAEVDRERLAFEVSQREHQLSRQGMVVRELERRLAELEIRSPVDGLVSRTDADDRAAVERGAPVVTVVDLSRYEADVSIPESYADDVTAGTPVDLRIGAIEAAGEIRRVAPEVATGLVTARVGFVGEPPPGLRQNQRVSAHIRLDERRGVLKVARGAFLDAGGHVTYVVNGDLAHRRRIRTGAASTSEVEIVEGLEIGETVVVSDLAPFGDAETVLLR